MFLLSVLMAQLQHLWYRRLARLHVHHVCCVCVEWQSFAVRCSVADESTEDGVWSSRDQEWSAAIRNTSQAYLEWERTGTPSSQHIAEPPEVSSWQS